MTRGVYKLNFKDCPLPYIGQSKNIEVRLKQHLALFRANKASTKLQKAYNLYGVPTIEILHCAENLSKSELDDLEQYYIKYHNAVEHGLNTRTSASAGANLSGERNGNSKYTDDQIIDALFLLVETPRKTYPIISEMTGVGRGTIVDIANGTGHVWLQKVFPEEYAVLMNGRGLGNSNCYKKAVSPDGVVYTVRYLSNFCSKHKLHTGNMSRLLRGKSKSYNGWTTE